MTCSDCGAENRSDRKFCAECGRPLTVACPACGGGNQPGERFCGECGAALTPGAAAVAARRIISTMPEAESSSDVQERAVYLSYLAAVLRAEGRPAEAPEAAEDAFAAREELGVRSNTVKVEETLAILESLRPGESTPFIQAQGARFSARLAALKSDAGGVQSGSASAIATFRELANPFCLAVALTEYGEWLISQRREGEAGPLLAEARELFEQLKATPWLDRLAMTAALDAGVTA